MKIEQEVFFQEARSEDAEGFIALLHRGAEDSDFLILDQDYFAGQEAALGQVFDNSFQTSDSFYLLAKIGQKPIGALTIKADGHPRMNHIGDLFMLVAKDYWNQGIGQILLEEGIRWAEETASIRRLELTVQKRNSPAVHLYEKFGFEIEGTKQRGAKTKDGEFLDVYLMGKLID
ncbi:GNAT family N-acetyltransferase [Streptococcus ferus]|uniref:GNAT family N-acetyltransferase n=1 Tax=Streptococcus ferus TaxID=1345 RepID=UPI00359F66C8